MSMWQRVCAVFVLFGAAACGGGDTVGGTVVPARLVFVTQPADASYTDSLQVEVRFEAEDGSPADVNLPIGINVLQHNANPLVIGTQEVWSHAGAATFDNLNLAATISMPFDVDP